MKAEDTMRANIPAEDRPFTDEEWERAKPVHQLKTWRTMLRLDQEQFCKQFGISVSTLCAWEEGLLEMDREIMLEVSELLLEKREQYFAKHGLGNSETRVQGISTADAWDALHDPLAIEMLNASTIKQYTHILAVGMASISMLAVTYARCNGNIDIISTRLANHQERRRYFAANPIRGSKPFVPDDCSVIKAVPSLWRYRTLMGMSEQDFCSKFGISINTLRDWEDGQTEMDEGIRFQIYEKYIDFILEKEAQNDIQG